MRTRLRLIRWFASKLCLRPITVNGLPYLDRYYIAGPMPSALADLWPEDDRPRERLAWLRRTWLLHRFYTHDDDRHLYNHPWDARGRVLFGGYIEERRDTKGRPVFRPLNAGDRQRLSANTYHRITSLFDEQGEDTDEVWTLLRVGPKVQRWGFVVDGEHVPWQEYLAAKEG